MDMEFLAIDLSSIPQNGKTDQCISWWDSARPITERDYDRICNHKHPTERGTTPLLSMPIHPITVSFVPYTDDGILLIRSDGVGLNPNRITSPTNFEDIYRQFMTDKRMYNPFNVIMRTAEKTLTSMFTHDNNLMVDDPDEYLTGAKDFVDKLTLYNLGFDNTTNFELYQYDDGCTLNVIVTAKENTFDCELYELISADNMRLIRKIYETSDNILSASYRIRNIFNIDDHAVDIRVGSSFEELLNIFSIVMEKEI